MITTPSRSKTLAPSPNSRLKMPIVPGPHTSCVSRTLILAQMFSPGVTVCLPAARARIFSVSVCFIFECAPGEQNCAAVASRYAHTSAAPGASQILRAGAQAWRTSESSESSRGRKKQRTRLGALTFANDRRQMAFSCKSPVPPEFFLERVKGVGPSPEAWEASILPLNYTRKGGTDHTPAPHWKSTLIFAGRAIE